MNNFTISDAILFLIPNAQFRIVADDLTTLEFFAPLDQKHPTQDEINSALNQLAANHAQSLINAENAKAAAQAKLEALGLTADDLKALGL
jgi:hypothetical protein